MTIRNIILIGFILVFVSCSNNSKYKQTNNIQLLNLDKSQQNNIVLDSLKRIKTNSLISDRFLKFAKLLDSIGYSSDTIRLNKTYNISNNSKRFIIDNYSFYDYNIKQFIQIINGLLDSDSKRKDKIQISLKDLEKAQSVFCYFYTKKTPEILNKEKWFIDGIIYELKFKDVNIARNNAIFISNINEIYEFGSTFICYIDNYIYIFHSRLSAFSTAFNHIYKYFLVNNKAIVLKNKE